MDAINALSLPPGFGFHPTDVELISHYLKRKILGHKFDFEVIPEVDIYKHEPWDLPAKSQIPTRDCKWHFFTSRDRKYPNGSRSNRATEAGYWKSTGKDRNVRFNNRIIGTKKTLVFHEGKPPYGKRTDWIMHEYYSNENECKAVPTKDIFVLCRVTKRNGLTKEDEKVVTTNVENNISPCAPISCSKELQDASVHLMSKEEVCSPAESVDDYEAWFKELYDPNFFTYLSESKSEDMVDVGSLTVKHDMGEKRFPLNGPNQIEERAVSTPEEHGSYGVFEHQFNAYECDVNLFGLSSYAEDADAIFTHHLEPALGVDYPSYPGYVAGCTRDEELAKLPRRSIGLLADHQRMIPEANGERISTLDSNFSGNQGAVVDTGIQIRERHGNYSNESPSHPHRIRLQVHKMESRNPGPINQTFVFVSEDGHLDSPCKLNEDPIPLKAKADPDMSGAFGNSHQVRTQLQEKLTYENSSSAPISLHDIKSHGRKYVNNVPEDPSSKSNYKLASMLSMLLHQRQLEESCNPSKISMKYHYRVSQTCGLRRGICPLLRKCSLAGLNCMFLATCMIGTASLIAFFLVRDARRFLGNSHCFDL